MRLSLVMPVFNEAATLPEILRRVAALDLPKQLVLVDDCSTDGSRELLERIADQGLASVCGADPRSEMDVRVVFQDVNQGKGAALRRGFSEATGDVVAIQDADLEYDPQDILRLIQPIRAGVADVVFGSRFVGSKRPLSRLGHTLANRGLTMLSNVTTGLKLTDMETCYKVFHRDALMTLRLEENRFGIEPELTAKIAQGRFRVHELPISYDGRSHKAGKKIGWRDGVRALYAIMKYGLLW